MGEVKCKSLSRQLYAYKFYVVIQEILLTVLPLLSTVGLIFVVQKKDKNTSLVLIKKFSFDILIVASLTLKIVIFILVVYHLSEPNNKKSWTRKQKKGSHSSFLTLVCIMITFIYYVTSILLMNFKI